MPTLARLLVTFSNDGKEEETQLAASGERALKIALLMLARRDALRHGDQLTVQKTDAEDHTAREPR
jgi:hypothetical protein